MNILVAGIHGVGKTYLASRAARRAGRVHTSASRLINEQRTFSTWTLDKRVSDVDANQEALIASVRRHNDAGTRLLFDGHFVLIDATGGMIRLDVGVFLALNLNGAVLLEADPQIVAQRIEMRDLRLISVDDLQAFLETERDHAKNVCAELQIPLAILVSPSLEEFAAQVMILG